MLGIEGVILCAIRTSITIESVKSCNGLGGDWWSDMTRILSYVTILTKFRSESCYEWYWNTGIGDKTKTLPTDLTYCYVIQLSYYTHNSHHNRGTNLFKEFLCGLHCFRDMSGIFRYYRKVIVKLMEVLIYRYMNI